MHQEPDILEIFEPTLNAVRSINELDFAKALFKEPFSFEMA